MPCRWLSCIGLALLLSACAPAPRLDLASLPAGVTAPRVVEGQVNRIDEGQFRTLAETTEQTLLVDFTASWCPPCQMMEPHLQRVAADTAGVVTVVQVDVSNPADNRTLAQMVGVHAIPTLAVVRQQQIVKKLEGFHTAQQMRAEL